MATSQDTTAADRAAAAAHARARASIGLGGPPPGPWTPTYRPGSGPPSAPVSLALASDPHRGSQIKEKVNRKTCKPAGTWYRVAHADGSQTMVPGPVILDHVSPWELENFEWRLSLKWEKEEKEAAEEAERAEKAAELAKTAKRQTRAQREEAESTVAGPVSGRTRSARK
ncbi:hypothetical protein OQA88_9079 [Cercophora sp. LCS_1]